ncbi:hypothetical protein H2201_002927 [Coniosporium apollinis]|uniref:TOG domain-containing protein n=2 Tax=Coniosporium TaxID=2810619 RepID=A0ABQ9NYA2_9PEZI|nr:hypothetical protein H2199_006445 [Cladosporium sp. JES 115]KAJ9667092.1 hypothetical protein H2201_002927 [Coniosporium apollinis]
MEEWYARMEPGPGGPLTLTTNPPNSETRNKIFQTIKNPCVQLSQAILSFAGRSGDPKEVLVGLERLYETLWNLSRCEAVIDEKLAEYIFFPLSHVFRESQRLPLKALETALKCLSILLRTGWRSQVSPELSRQLLILLSFLAGGPSDSQPSARTSEELQAAAFICLSDLFKSLSQSLVGRTSLIATPNIPPLGHAVTTILSGITSREPKEIQLAAMTALQAFCLAMTDQEALASFLPGIISSLTKVLTYSTTSRRPYKVLVRGLDVLSRVLRSVVSDDKTRDLPKSQETDKVSDVASPMRLTASWLKATAAQLKMALANVIKLRQHPRTEVHQALSELCVTVLEACQNSLSDSGPMMIETLVVLSASEDSETEHSLKRLLASNAKNGELLTASLLSWVVSLPRTMESADDSAKRKTINQISRAFTILSEQGTNLTIVNRAMATSLRDSLYAAIHAASGNRSIVQTGNGHSGLGLILPGQKGSTAFEPIVMTLRGQAETANELVSLLKSLSTANASMQIAKELTLAIPRSQGEMQLASFWLALNLLKSTTNGNVALEDFMDLGPSSPDLQSELLDEIFAYSISILSESTLDLATDWRMQAVAVEAVAHRATQLGGDFRIELVDALYPVVQLLASPVAQLRSHAITCLNIMSDACGYSNTSEMIVSNVDYLVNAVALQLNDLNLSPQAPQVLLMMVKLSGPSLLPYLDDLVDSVFAALENYHGYSRLVELLFSVLKGIAEEGAKTPQLAITHSKEGTHRKDAFGYTTMADVIRSIRQLRNDSGRMEQNLHQNMEDNAEAFPSQPWKDDLEGPSTSAHNSAKDVVQDRNGNEVSEVAEQPPPVPKTYSLLLKISQLTQHYLTSSSPNLRTSLLSLLEVTIPALAAHEDSFLPLINTLWPVLVPRLDDSEAYVVANALDVIGSMCMHAGDFMRGRIDDLWEDIRKVYRRNAPNQAGKARSRPAPSKSSLELAPTERARVTETDSQLTPFQPSNYIKTPTRLVWDALVRFLTMIVNHVAISEDIFDDILEMLSPLLERDTEVRNILSSRNPDAVWLAMLKRSSTTGNAFGGLPPSVEADMRPAGGLDWEFAAVNV